MVKKRVTRQVKIVEMWYTKYVLNYKSLSIVYRLVAITRVMENGLESSHFDFASTENAYKSGDAHVNQTLAA